MRVVAVVLGGAVLAVVSCQPSSHPLPQFVRIQDQPPTTERYSTGGVSWIDYDGDGDVDLFSANGYDVSTSPAVPQENQLYENLGDGNFRTVESRLSTDSLFSSGSAWADIDNDGDLDAFVPNQRGQANHVYRNEGRGQFVLLDASAVPRDSAMSYSGTWADVDADGLVDLFVSNGGLSGAQENALYRNLGDGRFETAPESPLVAAATQSGGATFVDFDLDGDVDAFVPGQTVQLFRNDGSFAFTALDGLAFGTERPMLTKSVSGAWGDHDNDGDFDVYVTYELGEVNRLYVNEGDGGFVRGDAGFATLDGGYTVHAIWADLDNNGYLDLVVANWGSPAQIYVNHDGSFTQVVLGDLGTHVSFGSSLARADYDGDGDVDVLVGHWPNHPGPGEENLLYRNDGPVGNWLRLDLVGTRSNRGAIGARVTAVVELDGREQTLTREVRSQDGWRSQNELTVHLGLGAATQVSELTIHWPSGGTQRMTSVAAGQRMTIREQ